RDQADLSDQRRRRFHKHHRIGKRRQRRQVLHGDRRDGQYPHPNRAGLVRGRLRQADFRTTLSLITSSLRWGEGALRRCSPYSLANLQIRGGSAITRAPAARLIKGCRGGGECSISTRKRRAIVFRDRARFHYQESKMPKMKTKS